MEIEKATLFGGLAADVLAKVRELARVREYAAGETIFNEGDPADDIYILREGFVELTYTLPQDPSTEIRITRIAPGETFAWSALAKGGTLSSHARALIASSAYTVPADRLHALFAERPGAGYEVMTRLAQQILSRLRETRKELRWLHHGAR